MTASTSRFSKLAKRVMGMTSVFALAFTTAFQPLAVAAKSKGAQGVANNYIQITSENANQPKLIRLGLNKSIVVDLPAVANDVLVANPTVADAVMRTNRRIYLFGKEQGQTNIFVFDGSGKQIAAMEILIERDISGLEGSLERLIPNSNIRAEMINGSVVLTGTVSTPADASQAVNLATAFLSATGEQNFFTQVNEGDLVNLIKIEGEDQVQLRVTVAEISRAVVKQLGVATTASSTQNGFGFQALGTGSRSLSAPVASSIGSSIVQGTNILQTQLNAMESAGVVRTLAEPNLTAVSGQPAEFQVGGTQYFPTDISTDDDGSTTVTYEEKPYGLNLSFLPVVLTEGRISLQISTSVNEPTPLGAAQLGAVGGYAATRNRSAKTTIELPSGGLANVPILGSLFRSREFIRNESELVIIVTPYLVRPTAKKNLIQPDENFQPASDAAGMFMGRVNRVYGTKQGNLPKGRYTGSIGFILK